MSNSRLARLGAVLVGAALALGTAAAPGRADDGDVRYDPQPAPGDLAIPMPGGLNMVVRPVRVAGPAFWGDPRRMVTLGNAGTRMEDVDVFETPREVMVSGSFPAPDGQDWVYYLGKYEVSKAQAAAILGAGDLDRGVEHLVELSGNPRDERLPRVRGAGRDRLLADPVAWLSHQDVLALVDAYNLWCFETPACLAALPTLDGVPGHFRLPTEVEWAYAARGGYETAVVREDEALFARPLPFPDDAWRSYAWVAPAAKSAPRRIGSLDAVYGFHDMIGNVQELTAELFRPELDQGKPGALVARGGSFLTSAREIRTSYRSEVEIYRWTGDRMVVQRSPTTGFRLAIGSPVIASDQTRTELARSYQDYRSGLQRATPAGARSSSPFLQAAGPIRTAIGAVEALMQRYGLDRDTSQRLNRMRTSLFEANELIAKGLLGTCMGEVRQAIATARGLGYVAYGAGEIRGYVRVWSGLVVDAANADVRPLLEREQARLNDVVAESNRLLAEYAALIHKIDGCGPAIADQAIARVGEEILDDIEQAALALITTHLADSRRGRTDLAAWQSGLETELAREEYWDAR